MKIFDIGANRGLFTDKCLEMFGDDLDIITIEANPYLSELLENKYKKFNTVKVLNNLVSEETNQEIDFYISNVDTISTASIDWITKSRFTSNYTWYNPIKIKSVSLDGLISTYGIPDLIKIDVEGYELEVVKGLSNKAKEICFEWAEEQYENINLIIKHLQSIGYEKFGFILGDEYMKRPDTYLEWGDSDFHKDINIDRKETWGMIWTK